MRNIVIAKEFSRTPFDAILQTVPTVLSVSAGIFWFQL
jgi:hypothetical protein